MSSDSTGEIYVLAQAEMTATGGEQPPSDNNNEAGDAESSAGRSVIALRGLFSGGGGGGGGSRSSKEGSAVWAWVFVILSAFLAGWVVGGAGRRA